MANMSDAHGTMTINYGGNIDCLKTLLETFDDASNWEYPIFTANSVDKLIKNEDGTVYTTFDARGCWMFHHLLECFFYTVEESVEDGSIKIDLSVLKNTNFEILFEYQDYEPGNGIFYETSDRLIHKAGVPITKIEIIQGDICDLDLSWGNRLMHDVETEDSLCDELAYMSDLEVFEFLNKEKEGLETYFEKPFEEILDDELSEFKEIYLKKKKQQKKRQLKTDAINKFIEEHPVEMVEPNVCKINGEYYDVSSKKTS